MASDLHTHTTFSDGKLTPEELISAAREAGLHYLAITDHDTVDALVYLYENGLYPKRDIHLIPGIEFSAHHPTQEVHILGFNVDIYNKNLLDKLNEVTDARWTRFSEIVEKLNGLGYQITETEVLQIAGTSKAISRSHIARILVKRGYFDSVREAFDKLLSKGRPAYVPHYRLEPEEIIALIREAGGQSVLAHPKLVFDDDLVEDLLRSGLDGIEVFYPKHDEEDTKRYMALAEKYHLLVSGGSDFHGFATRYPQKLGQFVLDDEYAKAFYRPE